MPKMSPSDDYTQIWTKIYFCSWTCTWICFLSWLAISAVIVPIRQMLLPVIAQAICKIVTPHEGNSTDQSTAHYMKVSTKGPRQNDRHFADDIFKCVLLNENEWISIKISLKFVPKGRINNIPELVQMMAWRLQSDKSLSKAMVVRLPTSNWTMFFKISIG